jgi:hypothetical protein
MNNNELLAAEIRKQRAAAAKMPDVEGSKCARTIKVGHVDPWTRNRDGSGRGRR